MSGLRKQLDKFNLSKTIVLVLIPILLFVIFLSSLIVLNSSIVSATESTDNPFPVFQLIFSEFDAPVTILSAELISEEYTVPIPFTANLEQYIFTFSSNVYLLNGEYTLRILSEDDAGNTLLYEDTIEVDADVMNIWVENPFHGDYESSSQDVAVSVNVPFNATFKTEFETVCRIRKNVGSLADIPQIYENFMLTSFNDGNDIPSTTHTLHIAKQGVPNSFPPNSFVTVSEPFQNNNFENRDSFLVVCKQETAGGSPVYHPKIFYIGYNEENDGFEAHFTPELIEDTAALRTNLHITSNEDLQSCHYSFVDSTSPEYLELSGPIYSSYPINSIHELNTVYDKEFSFQTQLQDFPMGERLDYLVNVTCYDLSYKPISQIVPFSINLTTAFDINLLNSHTHDKKPTLNFQTSLMATCMYEFEYENEIYSEIIGDGSLQSNHPLELPATLSEDGVYSINLFCTADSSESKTFQFTLDTIPPSNPLIASNDYYCDDGLDLDIFAPINDTVQYNITLYNGSGTSGEKLLDGFMSSFTDGNFTFSLPSNIETNINSTYTWSVFAIDQGGLTSGTPVTKTITILDPSSLSCDMNPPYGSVEVKKVSEGFSFNISCMDLESGCSSNFDYSIVPDGTDCSSALLTSGSYGYPITSPSDGTLCYTVYDLAGNEWNGTKKLSSSIAADIEIQNPKFGIANTKEFLFSVKTNKEVTCKFGPDSGTAPSDVSLWYDSLEGFSMTGGLIHSTQIVASNYPSFDITQTEQIVPWVVICTDGSQYYKSVLSEFGYDVTDPVLTVSVSPNPVINAQNQEITISVSADDEVVCTYLGNDGVSRGFTNYDPNKRSSYSSTHSVSMSYTGLNNNDVLQKIKCRNVAQSVNSAEEQVHVQPENTAGIKITSSLYSKTTTSSLEVETSQDANCVYKLNDASTFSPFQSTGSTIHKKVLTLSSGENTLEIQCTAGTSVSTQYATLIVDSEKPIIEILSPSTTCSPNELKATFVASGTGSPIENYDYDLSNSLGEIIKTGLVSDEELTITEGLVSGESYTLSVTARDKAGNVKEANKKIMIGSGVCDSVAPSANVKNAVTWKKTLSTISCEDNKNDCTNYFTYYLDKEGSCQENQNSEIYSNQPLEITEPTTLCYTVYDSDNNKFSSSEFIQVHLQCFNGIEDPDEQGVDCGGPCAATCGLCDNGVQDPFEEGVDCGNVCATINTCKEDVSIPVVQDRECEENSDCNSGYYCSFRGQCVKESKPNTGQNYYDDEGSDTNILGLVLLILGLLLMGAGIGYIYYSQTKKMQERAQVQASQSQQQSQYMSAQQKARAAQIAKQQREAARRKAELLAQQKAKQSELEAERIAERKNKRSNLLGAFSIGGKDEEEKSSDDNKKSSDSSKINKKEIFAKVKITERPEQTKPTESIAKKVDVSANANADGYVALGDLSGKNSSKKQSTGKTSDSEDALSKLAHMKEGTKSPSEKKQASKEKVLFSEKTSPSQIRNKGAKLDPEKIKQSNSKSVKHSVFDDIDSLAQKSNLSSDPNEDYFKTLENTIQAAHGKSNDEIIESLATTIGNIQGKLNSKDFLDKFSNSALTKQLNIQTTKDLVALLVKEKKLTAKDAKLILEKLIGDKK